MSQETPATESAPVAAPARIGLTSREIALKLNGGSSSPASEKTAPVAAEPSAAGEASSPPSPVAEPPKHDHRTAQAILKAQKAEAESLKLRQAHEATSAELKALKARLEAAEKDPVAALKLAGLDPMTFGQKMLNGEITAEQAAARAEVDPEVSEMLEAHRASKTAAKQAAEAAQKATARAADLEVVKGALATVADQYPVLGSLPFIPDQLLTVIEGQGGVESVSQEDFGALCKQVQDHVVKETSGLLKNTKVLAELLKADGVKAALLEALGLKTPAERTEQDPAKRDEQGADVTTRTLSNRSAARVPSRTKTSSSADLAAKLNSMILGR